MNRDKNKVKICSTLLGGKKLEYTLSKTSRKTVGISIEKNGLVKVACPFRVSEDYINQLLQKKADWILNKLTIIKANSRKTQGAAVFEDGQEFKYLGGFYKLKLVEDRLLIKPLVSLDHGNLVIYFSGTHKKEDLKNSLKLWYVEQFKLVIEKRVEEYSKVIGVYPQRITVREQKTRWGSCSTKGNLNFNWKLIMAPLEVLDYVVIHELCHMKELNHSKNFWKLVEGIAPQYKKYRSWLKDNGDTLSLE